MAEQSQTAVEDRRTALDRCIRGIGRLTARVAVPGEVKRLPETLETDEIPLMAAAAVVPGGVGLLVATDKRLLWVDKGWVSFRVDSIDYERISMVTAGTGLVGGEIIVQMYDHQVIFSFIWNRLVFPLGNLIRARRDSAVGLLRDQMFPPQPQPASDPATDAVQQTEDAQPSQSRADTG